MQKLTYKLLALIASSLGLLKNRLHGFFKNQTSFMRLNYYPPCPAPQLALGLGRHKDTGAMTILAQDDVCVQLSYILEMIERVFLQVWSNDKYESVEHRVTVNSQKERFSIPFFINPSHSVWVEPLEELVDEQSPAKYKGYSWGKFYATRKLSNFKKLTTENIQVLFNGTVFIEPSRIIPCVLPSRSRIPSFQVGRKDADPLSCYAGYFMETGGVYPHHLVLVC
ncbi:UNVERIFIED_CONTAM: putative 2-oxoglutarate-dependent dioxygenase [Sesamum latifolium]|uniref:2-oxoglutarate-dependent dioxygenase n=1 Tax=Sesamum latifolium TaxID=2727402 RepID=A0AAW2V0C6_9LAMI